MSKVSVDEYLSKRSISAKSNGSVVKVFKAPPTWNADTRSARFVMSSETVDRMGDIIVQAGLDTEPFMANPQGLLFHNSRDFPIGLWENVKKVNGRPKRTEGDIRLLPEGEDETVDLTARHIAFGTLRTCSIGFLPKEIEFIRDEDDRITGGFRINESELIECSIVPVPANPDAIVKGCQGDYKLAYDLIEEVLDTYTKDSSGLVVPRETYVAARQETVLPRIDRSRSFGKIVRQPYAPNPVPLLEPDEACDLVKDSLKSLEGSKKVGNVELTIEVNTDDAKEKISALAEMVGHVRKSIDAMFSVGADEEHEHVEGSAADKHPDVELIVFKQFENETPCLDMGEWPSKVSFDKNFLQEFPHTERVDEEITVDLANASAQYRIILESPHDLVCELVAGTVEKDSPATVPGSRAKLRSRSLAIMAEAAELGI